MRRAIPSTAQIALMGSLDCRAVTRKCFSYCFARERGATTWPVAARLSGSMSALASFWDESRLRLREHDMARLVRVAFMLMVVFFLLSVAGSSATDSALRGEMRVDPAMAKLRSQSSTSPASPPRDVSEEKMLAWLLLLMRNGPGAR